MLPQTCIELLAGWIFPYGLAVCLAALGRGLGTLAMCTVGRLLLRDFVMRHIVSRTKFLRALFSIIDHYPRKAAVLVSVVELPISAKNYSWSISEAPIWLMV